MTHQLFSRWNRKLMPAVFLSLFVLVAVVFVGCDRESPVSADQQTDLQEQTGQQKVLPKDVKVEVLNLETAQYFYQGKVLQNDDMARVLEQNQSAIMLAGWGLPEENVVYVFPSQREFDSWAKSVQLAVDFSQLNKPTASIGDTRISASSGWSKLWDSYYWSYGFPYGSGANRYYPVTSSASTLGTFNDKAGFVDIYTGGYITFCELFQNTYFNQYGGWRLILHNPLANSVRKVILSSYGFNNITSSVKVHY